MEKLICGKVNLYRLQCPTCGEHNLSGNRDFYCTSCGVHYTEKKIKEVRIVSTKMKDEMIKAAKERQGNSCIYCLRSFGQEYLEKTNVLHLHPLIDRMPPFDMMDGMPKDHIYLICNVCNKMRRNLQFETANELKQYLKYFWSKSLSLGHIKLIRSKPVNG